MALTASFFIGGLSAADDKQISPELFKDGERVVFYGDSITHAGWYSYYINGFYSTRFPNKKITFMNAGIAGGSASSGLPRLQFDVLDRKPDTVYMMFGMNDVNRDAYKNLDETDEKILKSRENALKGYKANMETNIKKIKEAGAKLVLILPSPYDQYSQSAKAPNLAACNDGLAKCAEIGKEFSTQYKLPIVDLHSQITALMKANPEKNLAGNDRVHPPASGHIMMAYFLLKAQNFPSLVAESAIDAKTGKATVQNNCKIEELAVKDGNISFTYKANALPFPTSSGPWKEASALVPLESLNQETLKVSGLADGNYKLFTNEIEAGKFSAADFAKGINMANLKTAQSEAAAKIWDAVAKKYNAEQPLRSIVQTEAIIRGAKVDPADKVAADAALETFLSKVAQKEYYGKVFEKYRKYRDEKEQLVKAFGEAQENIWKVQKLEPIKIRIVKAE